VISRKHAIQCATTSRLFFFNFNLRWPCGLTTLFFGCCFVDTQLARQLQAGAITGAHLQPMAFGVSFNLSLQFQCRWSRFNGTCQKRPRELDFFLVVLSPLRFEIQEMTLQMQLAVLWNITGQSLT